MIGESGWFWSPSETPPPNGPHWVANNHWVLANNPTREALFFPASDPKTSSNIGFLPCQVGFLIYQVPRLITGWFARSPRSPWFFAQEVGSLSLNRLLSRQRSNNEAMPLGGLWRWPGIAGIGEKNIEQTLPDLAGMQKIEDKSNALYTVNVVFIDLYDLSWTRPWNMAPPLAPERAQEHSSIHPPIHPSIYPSIHQSYSTYIINKYIIHIV